jgi:hypothetical protein
MSVIFLLAEEPGDTQNNSRICHTTYTTLAMNSMILKSASFATRVPLSSRSHSRDHSHTCRAQELQGRVVSTSANNTTIVAVENVSVHPLYVLRAIRGTLSAGPRPGHPTHVPLRRFSSLPPGTPSASSGPFATHVTMTRARPRLATWSPWCRPVRCPRRSVLSWTRSS